MQARAIGIVALTVLRALVGCDEAPRANVEHRDAAPDVTDGGAAGDVALDLALDSARSDASLDRGFDAFDAPGDLDAAVDAHADVAAEPDAAPLDFEALGFSRRNARVWLDPAADLHRSRSSDVTDPAGGLLITYLYPRYSPEPPGRPVRRAQRGPARRFARPGRPFRRSAPIRHRPGRRSPRAPHALRSRAGPGVVERAPHPPLPDDLRQLRGRRGRQAHPIR